MSDIKGGNRQGISKKAFYEGLHSHHHPGRGGLKRTPEGFIWGGEWCVGKIGIGVGGLKNHNDHSHTGLDGGGFLGVWPAKLLGGKEVARVKPHTSFFL